MRIGTVLLVAFLLGLSFEGSSAFPTQQEQHLSKNLENIDKAAHQEASETLSAVDAMTKKTKQEQDLVNANLHFGERMTKEIEDDKNELKTMKELEKQSVNDANKMAQLAQKPGATHAALQEISSYDRDSTNLSEEIQKKAVHVQASLGHVAQKMKAANVPMNKLMKMQKQLWNLASEVDEKEMGTLGEDAKAPSQSYHQALKQREAAAHEMVESAEQRKREAKRVEKKARHTLMELSDAATKGYKHVMASKGILDRDVKGHEDRRLEADIEQQEATLEHTKLGQASPGQLEMAERRAESDDVKTPGARKADYSRWGADQSKALHQIEQDAHALAAYQTNSEHEIDQIAAPLK